MAWGIELKLSSTVAERNVGEWGKKSSNLVLGEGKGLNNSLSPIHTKKHFHTKGPMRLIIFHG